MRIVPGLARTATWFVSLSLIACSTPYRAQGIAGGYSEVQVDRNAFRVTYAGTIASNQAETDERALLRSAEVALNHGYPFFVTSGFAPTGSAMALAATAVSVPSTTITIYCYATRPETTAIVYDAGQIASTLGPKYHVY